MLKKRIIPCLDIRDGLVVKGINFQQLKNAGNPLALAEKYCREGADELVFLDITATLEKRKTLATLVSQIAKRINIPFTVGGGIATPEDAEALVKCGADKVSINSAAVKNPLLIRQIADRLGSQAVVVAIDTKKVSNAYEVFINGGTTRTGIDVVSWAKFAEHMGAGEILLTSMDADGTKNGFDIEVLIAVSRAVRIPVIASGGAGKPEDFKKVFLDTEASGALAAGIFHFGEVSLPDLKYYLKQGSIPIR